MMSDHEAIRQLVAIYASALDRKDYGGIAACFTPEAVVDYGDAGPKLQGRKAIAELMRSALEPLDVTQHFFTNFIIRLDGDTANLECDVLAQHLRQGMPEGETLLVGARYQVQLVSAADSWLMEHVHERIIWADGNRALVPGV
jgi:uncharacterized protein (TIGR02246 family)